MRRTVLFVIAFVLAVIAGATPSIAKKSLYLIKGDAIDVGPLLPPEQVAMMLEGAILPSLEAMVKHEKEKKILAGGIVAGGRAGVIIMEAESNEEVSDFLRKLPWWGIVKWKVIPLESFEHRMNTDKKTLDILKKGK